VFSPLADALDRRFLVNAALPSALLVLLTAFVTLAHADPRQAAAFWNTADPFPWMVLVVATGLVAVTVSAATPLLLRLFEGYWRTPAGKLLASAGSRHHRRRLAQLAEDPDAYAVIHLRYPLPTQPEQVMPTRFGNILRSAELYPRDRYGIDTSVTWPRLYQVLPERQVSQIAAARGAVDFLVVTSVVAGMFAAISAVSLWAAGASWWRFLLSFWGGAAVAWLTYLGTLAAAVTYGQLIRTAFDVHRGDLLARLDLADEPGLWPRLAQFWFRGLPVEIEPEPDEPAPEPPSVPGPMPSLSSSLLLLVGVVGVVGALALAVPLGVDHEPRVWSGLHGKAMAVPWRPWPHRPSAGTARPVQLVQRGRVEGDGGFGGLIVDPRLHRELGEVDLDAAVGRGEVAAALEHQDQWLERVVEVGDPLRRQRAQFGQVQSPGADALGVPTEPFGGPGDQFRVGAHGRVDRLGDVEEGPLGGAIEVQSPPRRPAQVLPHQLDPGAGVLEVAGPVDAAQPVSQLHGGRVAPHVSLPESAARRRRGSTGHLRS
jgi:hypothetical protein